MFTQETGDKIMKGCLRGSVHFLIYIFGVVLFLTFGIKIIGLAWNLFFLIPGFIFFTIIWIFAVFLIERSRIRSHTIQEDNEQVEDTSLTKGQLTSILQQGSEKIAIINKLGNTIDNLSMRTKVSDIANIVQKIFKNFEDNPKAVKKGKQFINYYLDASIRILQKYVDLSKHKELSPEAKQSLEQVEKSIDAIQNAFEKQLRKLLEDSIIDIDVELRVLKNTLKAEGLE